MEDLVEVVDRRHEEGSATLNRELKLLVLQHLHEQGFKETAHRLEQESGLFFDTKHLGDLVECGAWDEAERYLGGFTEGSEDPCSAKIFFAIRRQKYLEALGRRIAAKEGQILVNDLKALAPFDEEAAKMLRSLENFRQDEQLDTASARNAVFLEIKKLIEANSLFQDKLDFPSFEASRLRILMAQSLYWQHSSFKKLKQNPELTLSSDHSCDFPTNGARSEIEDEKIVACRTPNVKPRTKVVGLLYTSEGTVLLALSSDAVHKMLKWQNSDINPDIKLWQPANEIIMKNGTSNSNPEEATACIALSTHDSVMSASGGKVSYFCMETFKVLSTFISPPAPPAATSIAFHPRDSNIVALGMDDSTIQIYDFNARQAKIKLRGHQKMITGLAFPQTVDVLVSSGADAQICVWSYKGWKKIRSIYIQAPAGWSGPLVGATRVQFRCYSTYCLVIHESQLAIYNLNLTLLSMWSPRDTLPAPISSAVYSCDGLLVYAGFCDGAIGIFDAQTLGVRRRIAPSAYIPPSLYGAGHIYPMVVAAHPAIPNQIALGMNDGVVHVLEPM